MKNYISTLFLKRNTSYIETIDEKALLRFKHFSEKYRAAVLNKISTDESIKFKIECIDELIETLIKFHFNEALNSKVAMVTTNDLFSNIKLENEENIFKSVNEDNPSLLKYLHDKVKEYIINTYLIEAVLIHDSMSADTLGNSKESNRFSKSTQVYCNYLNATYKRPLLKNYAITRSDNIDLIKSLRKINAKANKSYKLEYITAIPEMFFNIPRAMNDSYNIALEKFQQELHYHHSLEDYAPKDITFLRWLESEESDWLSPSLFLYYGVLYDQLYRTKKKSNLYHHCEKFIKNRYNENNNDRNQDYCDVISAYNALQSSCTCLLENIEGKTALPSYVYPANKFLLNHILHQEFFSSINTDTYDTLSSWCVVELLMEPNTNSLITKLKKESIFTYNFLKLLLQFDINLKNLEGCDFIDNIHQRHNSTYIGNELNIPVNLIYRLLLSISKNIGSILSEIDSLYKMSTASLSDFTPSDEIIASKETIQRYQHEKKIQEEKCYIDSQLLSKFSEYVSLNTTPISETKLKLTDTMNNNQSFLNVVLLHLSSFTGILPNI